MSKVEQAVQWALNIANDNIHGYSQQNRWGPDYDCSSLVISAFEQAGVPVKSKGATYTGNMKSVFQRCGFKDVTSSCNLTTGAGMQRGDVLLNIANHTALHIGNGRIVHARSSEGNSTRGDQSGNEIRQQSYWNYPWDCVLRYAETAATEGSSSTVVISKTETTTTATCTVTLPVLKNGSTGNSVFAMQTILIAKGYSCGADGADGDFGNNTYTALTSFQKANGLEVDGVVGAQTWAKLLK